LQPKSVIAASFTKEQQRQLVARRYAIVPIDRDQLWQNKSAAKELLQSQAGVIVHELGHYAAANETSPVFGHLLVDALDRKTSSGKFVFSDEYKKQLDVERCAFISAAGAMAELYFCDLTASFRLHPDIVAYCSLLNWIDPKVTMEDLIGIWHNRYAVRIGELARNIEMNFERCTQLCATDAFLLDGVHVIPSYLLDPPYSRSQKEFDREFEETSPLAARQTARKTFRIAH
jgi:hypothetical protein